MLERQRDAGEHDAEQGADARARRVQRAVAAAVAHGVVPPTVSSVAVVGSGTGTSRPCSSATAK